MSKIEITILGTTAGIPTKQRAHPSIYLIYRDKDEFCYLFDCGEGTQRQILLANLNPMKLDEIFITHWHGDHYLGLAGLIDTMGFENRQRPLTVYAPEAWRVKRLLNVGYSTKRFMVIPRDVPFRGSEITTILETDRFKIVSTPVEHGVPSVAYGLIEKDKINIDKERAREVGLPAKGLIYRELKEKGRVVFAGKEIRLEDIWVVTKGKKVVYSGDTEICDNLIRLTEGADLLIQDCTYFDDEGFEGYRHASIKDVIKMLEEVRVKRVILTHISRRYKNPKELKNIIKDYPNLAIAEDFMRITI